MAKEFNIDHRKAGGEVLGFKILNFVRYKTTKGLKFLIQI